MRSFFTSGFSHGYQVHATSFKCSSMYGGCRILRAHYAVEIEDTCFSSLTSLTTIMKYLYSNLILCL